MSQLHEAILALQQALPLVLRGSPKLPHPQTTEILVQSLGSPEPRKGPPPTPFLEELRRRLVKLYVPAAQGEGERRDLRDAPWLFWNGTPPLASLPRLVSAVHAQASEHDRTLRNLIEAWISAFNSSDPTIAIVGQQIGTLLVVNTDRRLDIWRRAQARIAFFDAGMGPRRLAEWLLSGPEPVNDALATAGLDDPVRGGGGYARALQGQVLSIAPVALRSPWAEQALARGLAFLALDHSLRFEDQRGEMARGLTKPWQDQGVPPPETIRSATCEFLVRHLKDPRTNPGNWQAAGEETTSLVRRWLVRASLDMFFGLIAQFALDQHWHWRAAFWKACMDRCNKMGVPFDAWVALGPRVHGMARASRDLRGAYGRITGAGVQGNHSVLLMRVGPVTLCDWSHDGSLRAWPNDWHGAPRLYRPEYERSEMTGKCLPFPSNPTYGSRGESSGKGLSHFNSDRNYWQGSAAELLAHRAGVRLTAQDWQPR